MPEREINHPFLTSLPHSSHSVNLLPCTLSPWICLVTLWQVLQYWLTIMMMLIIFLLFRKKTTKHYVGKSILGKPWSECTACNPGRDGKKS